MVTMVTAKELKIQVVSWQNEIRTLDVLKIPTCIFYSYAHNKGTDQTARMRIQIRILVVRCSDNLFIGFCMPNSTLRRAAETEQAFVVLSRHKNNTLIL